MEAINDINPLWDISQASSFSHLPDDDFLALLQKQFPTNGSYAPGTLANGINPQDLSNYPLPSLTPPSEDSSPSPPQISNEPVTRSPTMGDNEDTADPALKRKASDEDFEEGPSQKNQHTLPNNKKGGALTNSRRKSSGTASAKDEVRLLKRKEQNRAAQRAFRERKERHVKDLEDKVAALEAKNEQTQSENDNLRDMVSRLQTENVILRSAQFTFSLSKGGTGSPSSTTFPQSPQATSPLQMFGSPSTSSVTSPPSTSSHTSPKTAFSSTALDWNSLTSFDPSMLSLLDESPQTTATDSAMHMNLSFGGDNSGLSANAPYTTIASNPAFMSFASVFDNTPSTSNGDVAPYNFDINSMPNWTPTAQPPDTGSLDELFSGFSSLGTQPATDFASIFPSSSSSLTPVSHQNNANGQSPPSSTSSSSPSSGSDHSLFGTPRDSSVSESEGHHNEAECPKTKEALAAAIKSQGDSPFVPSSPPVVRKSADSVQGSVVTCKGSTFPKVEKSDKNIEVLSAWRSITTNPRFKDVDINDLCMEFTKKAKCDGTKVVLEPQGVHHILETLSSKKQQ